MYNEFISIVVFVDDTTKTYKKRTKLQSLTDQNYFILENLENQIYEKHGQNRIKSISTELIIK